MRRYKGAYSGEHGDGLVRSEWIGAFGPRLTAALRGDQVVVRSRRAHEPRQDREPRTKRTTRRSSAMRPATRSRDRRRSTGRRGTCERCGDGKPHGAGRATAGLRGRRRDVQQQRALPQVRRRAPCAPSYRATRDERHLTRGRANTLRLALSGQIERGGLAGDAVREALELCVSCKGCRRECPTGVDMARMKIEALPAAAEARHLHARSTGRGSPAVGAVGGAVVVRPGLRNPLPGAAKLTNPVAGLPRSVCSRPAGG